MAGVTYLSDKFDEVFVKEVFKMLKNFLPEYEPMGYIIEDNMTISPIYTSYGKKSKKLIAHRKKNKRELISYLTTSCSKMNVNLGRVNLKRIKGNIRFNILKHKDSLILNKECYIKPDYSEFDEFLNRTLESVEIIYPRILKDVIADLELRIEDEMKKFKEPDMNVHFSYKGGAYKLESCFNALCKAGLFFQMDLSLFISIMTGEKPKQKMRLAGSIPLLKTFIVELREKFSLDGTLNESAKNKPPKKVYYEAFAPFFSKDSKEIKGSTMASRAFNDIDTAKKTDKVKRAVNHLF